MDKQCKKCECNFYFDKSDIEIKNRIIENKKLINRRAKIKRYLWRDNEYSGVETYAVYKYLVHDNVIGCPVCKYSNFLFENNRELIEESKYERDVSSWEMFGPNHPISGCQSDENAINGWLL